METACNVSIFGVLSQWMTFEQLADPINTNSSVCQQIWMSPRLASSGKIPAMYFLFGCKCNWRRSMDFSFVSHEAWHQRHQQKILRTFDSTHYFHTTTQWKVFPSNRRCQHRTTVRLHSVGVTSVVLSLPSRQDTSFSVIKDKIFKTKIPFRQKCPVSHNFPGWLMRKSQISDGLLIPAISVGTSLQTVCCFVFCTKNKHNDSQLGKRKRDSSPPQPERNSRTTQTVFIQCVGGRRVLNTRLNITLWNYIPATTYFCNAKGIITNSSACATLQKLQIQFHVRSCPKFDRIWETLHDPKFCSQIHSSSIDSVVWGQALSDQILSKQHPAENISNNARIFLKSYYEYERMLHCPYIFWPSDLFFLNSQCWDKKQNEGSSHILTFHTITRVCPKHEVFLFSLLVRTTLNHQPQVWGCCSFPCVNISKKKFSWIDLPV